MTKTELSDDFVRELSRDLFGDGPSAIDVELEEIEREAAARRRLKFGIGMGGIALLTIAALVVAWRLST